MRQSETTDRSLQASISSPHSRTISHKVCLGIPLYSPSLSRTCPIPPMYLGQVYCIAFSIALSRSFSLSYQRLYRRLCLPHTIRTQPVRAQCLLLGRFCFHKTQSSLPGDSKRTTSLAQIDARVRRIPNTVARERKRELSKYESSTPCVNVFCVCVCFAHWAVGV